VIQAGGDGELFWCYIIQRNGSTVIIDFKKFDSEHDAVTAAHDALLSFTRAAAAE